MTAAIKHEKPQSFGLWYECPDDAQVAWGARAIADRGVGFSIVWDRQTWMGDDEDRESFSAYLNDGPLEKANEHCKRLREGYSPWKELSQGEFAKWWDALRGDPEYSGAINASVYATNPHGLWRDLHGEERRAEAHWKAYEREMEKLEGQDMPPPPPPRTCEGTHYTDEDEVECEAKFTKTGPNEYTNCYYDEESLCWVCDECDFYHDVSEETFYTPMEKPVLDSVKRIVHFRNPQMFNEKAGVFTLFEDDKVIVKGNTNGSYGYVYLVAYPKGQWA